MIRKSGRHGILVVLTLAVLSWGCGARWAYRQGQREAKKGNWDVAVARLTKALRKDPDHIGYKIALENARIQASRSHYAAARKHMAADELDQAAEELDIASKFDPGNRSASDDLLIVRDKIRRREEEKQRLSDYEAMKGRAQAIRVPVPVLSPRSTAPITVSFPDQSLEKVFEALGKLSGVNILFDPDFRDKKVRVSLTGVTFQEALDQLAFTHRLFYKVVDRNTLILVPESQAKRRVYDDVLLQTFYIQNAEMKEVEAVVKTALGAQAKVMSNPTLGALNIIATLDELALARRLIDSNDKSKGEVIVEVQILEVNRDRLKDYGIALSNYGAAASFSPIDDPAAGGLPSLTTVRAHLLSSINLSDFIVSIPSTVLTRFLQTDSTVRILASPRLRAAEGKKTSLRIGTEVPVPVTTFTSAAPGQPGGGTFAPATSFQYRNVGVNLELTPKVNASGEILLEVSAEFSLLGTPAVVAGTTLPTFLTRNVTGILRLRDGEMSLFGGLLQERETESLSGILGLQSVPILNKVLTSSQRKREQTEILISIRPHLLRAPKILEADLRSVNVGTKEVTKVAGARPPLFGPEEETPSPEAPPSPGKPQPPSTQPPSPGEGRAPPRIPPVAPPLPSPEVAPAPAPAPAPRIEGPQAGRELLRPVTAQLGPAQVALRAGESGSVSLVVMNVQDLMAVEFVLNFDPSFVEALDVSPGTLLTLDGAAVGVERGFEPGRARAKLTRVRGTSGSGLVASVAFKGVAPGQTTVTIESLAVTLATGVERPTVASPVQISVAPGGKEVQP